MAQLLLVAVLLAIVFLGAAHERRRLAEVTDLEGAGVRHIGPRSYMPWVAVGLAILGVLVALLLADVKSNLPHDDNGCDGPFPCGPSNHAVLEFLTIVTGGAAALGALLGALSLRTKDSRPLGYVAVAVSAVAGGLLLSAFA